MTVERTTIAMLPLFDPAASERPPNDAIELYLETPVTLGLLHQLAPPHASDIAPAVLAAREAGVRAVLACLQRDGSHLKVGFHQRQPDGGSVGLFLPGRLQLTRVAHDVAFGYEDLPRFHDHLYVGAVGVAEKDGKPWPIDAHGLRTQVLPMLRAHHRRALRESLTNSLGVEWSIPDGPGDLPELVSPALAQYVPGHPRVICRDRFPLAAQWAVHDHSRPRAWKLPWPE